MKIMSLPLLTLAFRFKSIPFNKIPSMKEAKVYVIISCDKEAEIPFITI